MPINLLSRFESIKAWSRNGKRAPHKSLLILYALGKLLRNNQKVISFEECYKDIESLLIDFGPPRQKYVSAYPFLKLQNDDLWNVIADVEIDTLKEYGRKYLIKNNAKGGFSRDVLTEFTKNADIISKVISYLLDTNFPESIHNDVLLATNLADFQLDLSSRVKRDPEFRHNVLREYRYECAVCGYSLRVHHTLIGLEAAHVKWHALGGPDIVNNGLALCSLHHKLFDSGAFTINSNYKLVLSNLVNSDNGENIILEKFHEKQLRLPRDINNFISKEYLEWHKREVFRI